MRNKKLGTIFLVFFLIGLGFILFVPGKLSLQENRSLPPERIAPDSAAPVKDVMNPKIEYALGKLLDTYRTQGADRVRDFAAKRNIKLVGDRVRVVAESRYSKTIRAIIPEVAVLKNQIQALGGTVETTSLNLIQCQVPILTLEVLSMNPLVRYLRRPLRPHTTAIITSEGVQATGADLWQNLNPYRQKGGGVNVCILDVGFDGYQSLLGSELPANVTVKSFRSDGDITGGGEVHGTACAEIVHDMAPNANLWLVNFGTDVEQHEAVDYISSQGIYVVSYSLGWWNAGDGKGTGPIDRDVDRAANSGIVWVSAAGNDALDHFEGTFSDPDGDSYYEFPDGSEFLSWWVPANTETGAYLNWDDWGSWNNVSYRGSNQDYDLYLYYSWGGVWYLAGTSAGLQTGFQWPTEDIDGFSINRSAWWGIRIRKANATRNCKMEVFVAGNSGAINNNVPAGSLVVPADSGSAVAVGAVDWSDDSREPYHTYSSQGPTHDNRIKPDFSAPARVSTSTYKTLGYWFSGTSAATPHMAGAIALLKEKTPYSLEQVIIILEGRAVDLGDPGKDNIYGAGSLKLKKK
jgi:hypothetical protein